MADRNTVEQVEIVIAASFTALDQICTAIADRDVALHVVPTSMFLPFAARSQLLRQSPAEQLRWINAGLALAGEVLGPRSSAAKYGKGRRSAGVTVEMAQKACELAKEEIDETNLVVHRQAARDRLLYKAMLEFCVIAKLLEPCDMGQMMSLCNEHVAEVIRSGWLTRNEIKIG